MFLILILIAHSVDAARRVVTLAPRVVTFATRSVYAAPTGKREGLTCTFVHYHRVPSSDLANKPLSYLTR